MAVFLVRSFGYQQSRLRHRLPSPSHVLASHLMISLYLSQLLLQESDEFTPVIKQIPTVLTHRIGEIRDVHQADYAIVVCLLKSLID